MGRKQQSYWTVRYKYLSLSSHMWLFNGITWPSCSDQRQYGVFPSAGHLYRAYLRCHRFLNNSPISQFHHPLLTNQNAVWPNWPTWQTFHQLDQLPTNFSPTWPAPHQIHQIHQLFTNFSPTLAQLFTSFFPTWPTFHQLHQLFTNFTNFSPTSPTLHQNHQRFTNFSPTSPFSPTFHQLFTNFSPTWPTNHQVRNRLGWIDAALAMATKMQHVTRDYEPNNDHKFFTVHTSYGTPQLAAWNADRVSYSVSQELAHKK